MSQPILEIRGVSKSYGERLAVDDLDLTVKEGEFVTLLGPNGAGKTTTLKMVTGLLRPDLGSVSIGGHDLWEEPVAAKSQLGYIPDRLTLYRKLTGHEILDFVSDLYQLDGDISDWRRWLTERFGLSERLDDVVEGYSQGMRQRLGFCIAFLPRPRLAVIDEPWVGLDPRAIRLAIEFLNEQAQAGTTILMSTHTLTLAQEISHRTGIIHKGRLVTLGSIDEILEEHRVAAALGSTGSLEDAFLHITADEEAESPQL